MAKIDKKNIFEKKVKKNMKKTCKKHPCYYIIQPLSAHLTKSKKSVSHWEISSVSRITPLKRVFNPYGGGSRFFKWSLEGTRQRI